MNSSATPRFLGLSLEHPGASERLNGAESYTAITIDRRLKGGKIDTVPLDRADLLRIIGSAAKALEILGLQEPSQ